MRRSQAANVYDRRPCGPRAAARLKCILREYERPWFSWITAGYRADHSRGLDVATIACGASSDVAARAICPISLNARV